MDHPPDGSQMPLTRRLFLGLGCVAASGCLGMPHASAQARRLQVVATTGMIADAAKQIGGVLVDVRALMGPGVDPHGYRQTRADIAAMSRADLVLWHGLYLEAQLEKFLLDLGRRRAVVALGDALPRERLLAHDEYRDRFDPHIWMSPELWALVVDATRAALAKALPAAKAEFEANAVRHLSEVRALADYAHRVLASVPKERRVLISAHDAFKYFGAAFDFAVEGIQGISTESEAGLVRVRELVDLIVERKVAAVFVESSVSDRNVRALIEGAQARGHRVTLGGELFSDAMGPEGTYEGSYIGMIDHNVTTIARALGGDAPPRGLHGKLVERG